MRPTESELSILNVLWDHGPLTVRDVHNRLKGSEVGYTTVLKFLQLMTVKGLVTRDDSQRAHIYTAALTRKPVQQRAIRDMVSKVFQGSAKKLVVQALSDHRTSREDLEEIRKLLKTLEDEIE